MKRRDDLLPADGAALAADTAPLPSLVAVPSPAALAADAAPLPSLVAVPSPAALAADTAPLPSLVAVPSPAALAADTAPLPSLVAVPSPAALATDGAKLPSPAAASPADVAVLASPAAMPSPAALAADIKRWGAELGFARVGIAHLDLGEDEAHFRDWLRAGFNGDMEYMSRHGTKRSRPAELLPGTLSCVSVRMDYWPADAVDPSEVLAAGSLAYVSRYALGRDYHKLMRRRLQTLCDRVAGAVGRFGYRAFADSAPVLEKALARNAGLGWIGKHTNLIDRDAGSYFFLGEIYMDLPLPADEAGSAHCGSCSACIPACPTGAIVAPYRLDARRCISYLTIELKGSIPIEFRRAIGNRIYGCDDCQLACPWNKFARPTVEPGFAVRHGLDRADLVSLFSWSEAQFVQNTRGSAIRRIGYARWLRNLAVALGNAPTSDAVLQALEARADAPSAMVREHVHWALREHAERPPAADATGRGRG